MASRLAALLPRLVALTVIWLLATSTITFAAGSRTLAKQAQAQAPATEPADLVVPDVRRQPYVFAKGILEDGGFAWRVEGTVQGYAANIVAVQVPAPGVRVVDNGSPTIVLRLMRNGEYQERGLPENTAPYPGDPLILASEADDERANEPTAEETTPSRPKPVAKPAKKPVAAPAKTTGKQGGKKEKARPAAFEVAGAPPEPLDEMPLLERARLLKKRIAAHESPSSRLVKHWLYQHAWIVTGARFGWSGGADALRTLVRVDASVQARWGIGAKSAAVARAALAEVQEKSR
jgi:hypothetical protein